MVDDNPFRSFAEPSPRRRTLPPRPALALEPKLTLAPIKRRVFIVHGHNNERLTEVENFVHKANWTPVVLKNVSQSGANLIDELVNHSKNISLAIIIVTGDDVARPKTAPEDPLKDRGRQNVIFEFGFLIHQLGKPKVFVLHDPGVELPSDYNGVIYTRYDPAGAWRTQLAKAIKAAGFNLNLNQVL